MHLIGINGYKRSGKNTTAGILRAVYEHGEGVVYDLGFADKVKITGARALGFLDLSPRECIELMDRAKEDWNIIAEQDDDPFINLVTITGREYLQNIGVEMRKLFGADFWVDQVLPQAVVRADPSEAHSLNAYAVEQMYPDVDCVAFTDLRFENEAERVLALGGQVWRVNRPGCESDGHDSEQELPIELVTREIDNSKDISWLTYEVGSAANSL